MNRFLPLPLVLALAVPALADGAMDMLLLILTGGPLAAMATSAWGIRKSKAVAPGWPRTIATVFSVTGSVAGYWLGICIADYRVSSSQHAGVVAFWGPLALFFSAYFARIPSSVLSDYYPTTGPDSQPPAPQKQKETARVIAEDN